MNWSNLREHKCPKCGVPLASGLLDLYIYCVCGFTISHKRYEEIMVDMTRPKIKEDKKDNQTKLSEYEQCIDPQSHKGRGETECNGSCQLYTKGEEDFWKE